MNKVICIAGMPGAGKSVVADYLVERNFQFIRFGQVVLDEVKHLIKTSGGKPTEKLERKIREDLRKKHGKAVVAKLIIPEIDKMLADGNVVADGLYSFTEYKEFRKHYRDRFILIAVYTRPSTRYERLSRRIVAKDPKLRHRSFTKNEAKSRDFAEIENLEKGGPIAMADYTLINTKDKKHLYNQIEDVLVNLA